MLCLPKSIAETVKTAIKKGDVSLDKLYNMTSKERETIFAQYVGKDSASLVNLEYEKARLAATKKAAADYVSASDKGKFQKTATAGEFGKKLLTPDQTKKFAVEKIDTQIKTLEARHSALSEKLSAMEGETKANAQLKLNKIQDQIDRLNVRREDTQNPPNDRMLKMIEDAKGVLTDENFSEIASSKLGQEVTPAQGKYIIDQAAKLRELAPANKDALIGVTPEYLQARNNLEGFISSMNPASHALSIVRNLIEISRNNLITNISTPLKTFISGGERYVAGAIQRRLANMSLRGANPDLAKQISADSRSLFWKTGSNAAAMESLDDASSVLGSHAGASGKEFSGITGNEKFDNVQEGKGSGVGALLDRGVGKVAQASHYVAIYLEHNILFTKLYTSAFSDILNFRSADMAKAEGLTGLAMKTRAAELMRDAAKIEPATTEGKLLRQVGQEGAARTLNVNNTWASRFSVGMKNMFNKIHPDIPIGTLLEPIAKIPANIIANGISNTPVGIPSAAWDVIAGRYKIGSDSLDTRYEGMLQYKKGVEGLIRVAGAVGIAALVTNGLQKKDFRSDNYGNHFLLVGNTWINTEFFFALSPNLAGFMAMKDNPKENPAIAFLTGGKVGEGALGGVLNIPGVDIANQTIQSALGKHPVSDLESSALSRTLPAAVFNIFKDRPINRLFFGASGVETAQQVKADDVAKAKKAAATKAAAKK